MGPTPERSFLRLRYRAILSLTGAVWAMVGALMLVPLVLLLFYPEDAPRAAAFLYPGLAFSTLGLALWRGLRPRESLDLSFTEGGVIVLLSWVGACLASAVPLMIGNGLSFTQAVFESVSGWTTTGLSVVDVTRAGPLILFWRSLMQLSGGAGLAIIMLSALTGPTGPSVSSAEGREQLVPHVRRSARLVLMIYAIYNVIGITALTLAGMSLFDAVNHTFAALSTGGFGTHPESYGYWNSPLIEAITIVLMIAGNLSFVTSYHLMHGRLRSVIRNGEVRLQAGVLPVCIILLLLGTTLALYPTFGKALRVAAFESVTALTTTGFSTVGYGGWNGLGFLILIALMLIGGGTCSTAGGIKQMRVYLLFKSLVWEIKRPFLPRSAVIEHAVWEGERRVFIQDSRLRQIGAFVTLYLLTYLAGTLILVAHGYSLRDSLFEFASALGTVGLSIGVTLPGAPPAVLWTETLGMFLGRLEFFVIFLSVFKLIRDVPRLIRSRPARG